MTQKEQQEIIRQINNAVKKKLPKSRYIHSIGVAYTASSLAMRYDVDIHSAMVAGLLHDCAKAYSGDKLLKLALKYGITPSEAETKSPNLLHAKVGSAIAKKEYAIDDSEILQAIASHTTGRPDMSTLEKIIFIADYIEPNRKIIPNLDNVRKLAFSNIDKCIVETCEGTLNHLKNSNAEIDPATLETYEYYKQIIGE